MVKAIKSGIKTVYDFIYNKIWNNIKFLEALLARDIMELPEEAIQAAKRKFNPYDISNL